MARSRPKADPPAHTPTAAVERPVAPAVTANANPLAPRLDQAAEAYRALQPTLAAVDAALLSPLKGDLQRAAIAALGVATWAHSTEVHARFTEASACAALRFEVSSLARLERAALACWHVRHRAMLASATGTEAKVPPDLDRRSLEVRDRMFKCAEYNLDDLPEAVKVIEAVRPGTGYLDRANDLYALANLYAAHRDRLAVDRRNWRDDDEATARALYTEILAALGLVPGVEGTDWIEAGARAWHVLRETYAEVEAVGRCLYRRENPDALFPNLVSASRDARSPAKPAGAPADPTKPTG